MRSWCERERDPLFLFVYYLQSQKHQREIKKRKETRTMSVSLSVMTFNLHDDQPEESPNSWEKRKDLCLSVITSYSPVILCTQQGSLSFLSSYGWISSLLDLSSFFIFGLLSMNECCSVILLHVFFDLLFPLCRCEVAVRLYSAGFTRYTYYLFFFMMWILWRSRSRFYF